MARKPKDQSSADVKPPETMPEDEFILVLRQTKNGTVFDTINLDEFFGDTGPDLKRDVYLKAMEKFGQSNIRYCRVVPVKVRHDINIG